MHFRAAHDCDPVDWVADEYGSIIENKYSTGTGSYTIAREFEWLTSDMVCEVVETRTHGESLRGENNPMSRSEVAEQFTGEDNPAKRAGIRKMISESLQGHTVSEETREKISRQNTGNEISESHRKAVSIAASERDTSYMQTETYSEALSASLKGREPTYPTPYSVAGISHKVRSSWEAEIATLLVENDITYEYEREFHLGDGSYYPDFLVSDYVIEVKGFSDERSVENAENFIEEFPEYTYVVVGDRLPCDVHLSWEERSELIEVITDE
jgi:hypothetical protein